MNIGYARASLDRQPLDRQIDELAAAGVDRRSIYSENITGKRRDRPELNRMLAELQPGDVVLFTELTRLGRSTRDLLEIVDKIKERGANFKSLGERWMDTTTPWGQLIFTFFAGMAQFERDLTSERTKSGLAAARKRGRIGGRPSKQQEKAATVLSLYHGGMSKAAIARELEGVSLSTVRRIIAAAEGAGGGET